LFEFRANLLLSLNINFTIFFSNSNFYMNNHRCRSQKSLITIRKWLLEAGDGLSTSIYVPSSSFDDNGKRKSYSNKIIKRKKFNNKKFYFKTTSILDWFYQFIKKVFTTYDENLHNPVIDDTTRSIMTCSTCQLENVDAHIQTCIYLRIVQHFCFFIYFS